MTTIHFDRFKFNADAQGMTEEQLNKIDAKIWEAIHNPDKIRDQRIISEQLWEKGYIDVLGYRFFLSEALPDDPDDPRGYRILVSQTNDCANEWVEHVVPSLNREIVEAFIKTYNGYDCAWIVLKQEDIHVV